MATEAQRVQRYFEHFTAGFDRIYEARWFDRWWRRSMFERFRVTMELCGDVRGRRVLDVGCGSGRYSIELAKRGAEVVGVDFSQAMLDVAARAAQAEGVASRCRFVRGDIRELPLEGPFRCSLAIGVFDYTREPSSILERMRQLTRGRLIGSFPTRRHPLNWLRKIRLTLAGCPAHFYSRAQLHRLLTWPGAQPHIYGLGRDDLVMVSVA